MRSYRLSSRRRVPGIGGPSGSFARMLGRVVLGGGEHAPDAKRLLFTISLELLVDPDTVLGSIDALDFDRLIINRSVLA